ncbi:MAG: hypothetical protein CMG52_05475 [Candidatus Marinimicrobia bacterium]|jgi:hypothetical protein|nr:hypothetical protein [Candidatus Neomarinimicrobiota bacterium]
MKYNINQLVKDYDTESDIHSQVGNVAESNIIDGSDLIFRWPPVSSEIDPGSITHPNTDVLVERGKKVCSAFFGESFTFGDSIASIIKSVGEKRFRYDNFSYRMNNNLGGHFSRIMDTDYLLKAVPGQSNVGILMGLESSIEYLSETYDKVYIIVQLTETGRDWGHENTDSEELIELRGNSFYDYFVNYENWFSDKLNKLQEQYPNCEFIVWRNFTRWLGGDFGNIKTVDKVMIEYFYELTLKHGSDKIVNLLKNKYGDTLPVSVGGNPHWEELPKNGLGGFFHKDTESIQCILDECDKWEIAMDWMKDSNNIFEGRGGYHPSPIGHRVFAEYIMESLNLKKKHEIK